MEMEFCFLVLNVASVVSCGGQSCIICASHRLFFPIEQNSGRKAEDFGMSSASPVWVTSLVESQTTTLISAQAQISLLKCSSCEHCLVCTCLKRHPQRSCTIHRQHIEPDNWAVKIQLGSTNSKGLSVLLQGLPLWSVSE